MLILLVSLVWLPGPSTQVQEPGPVAAWLAQVNQFRLDEGLPPYGLSKQLTAAAQGHADYLASNQLSSHTGSGDSTPDQRIRQAGYPAWAWDSGELIVGENIWAGQGAVDDAMAFFLDDPPHRDNLLSDVYREIGIGAATDSAGRNYYVLNFGAQPNVLPIFINDDQPSTSNPQVAIQLTNEEARPEGQGTSSMGRAIEIRISDVPNWDDRPWQPWEPLVPWTLSDTPGGYFVYVQFRDAADRYAAASDSIFFGEGTPTGPLLPNPTPETAAAPEPAATPSPESAATLPPTAPLATESFPVVAPTVDSYATEPSPLLPGLTPFPTWTPLPTATPPGTSIPEPLPPWLATLNEMILPLLVAMQGAAIFLGIYLALRRGQER